MTPNEEGRLFFSETIPPPSATVLITIIRGRSETIEITLGALDLPDEVGLFHPGSSLDPHLFGDLSDLRHGHLFPLYLSLTNDLKRTTMRTFAGVSGSSLSITYTLLLYQLR
jgi:hypothetical protein